MRAESSRPNPRKQQLAKRPHGAGSRALVFLPLKSDDTISHARDAALLSILRPNQNILARACSARDAPTANGRTSAERARLRSLLRPTSRALSWPRRRAFLCAFNSLGPISWALALTRGSLSCRSTTAGGSGARRCSLDASLEYTVEARDALLSRRAPRDLCKSQRQPSLSSARHARCLTKARER